MGWQGQLRPQRDAGDLSAQAYRETAQPNAQSGETAMKRWIGTMCDNDVVTFAFLTIVQNDFAVIIRHLERIDHH